MKEWRVRVRWQDGHPPSFAGPLTLEKLHEFLELNLFRDNAISDLTITRGDFSGEPDRPATAHQAEIADLKAQLAHVQQELEAILLLLRRLAQILQEP